MSDGEKLQEETITSFDANRYREQAEYCRAQGRKAISTNDKEAWLKIAEDWLMLAEQASRNR